MTPRSYGAKFSAAPEPQVQSGNPNRQSRFGEKHSENFAGIHVGYGAAEKEAKWTATKTKRNETNERNEQKSKRQRVKCGGSKYSRKKIDNRSHHMALATIWHCHMALWEGHMAWPYDEKHGIVSKWASEKSFLTFETIYGVSFRF